MESTQQTQAPISLDRFTAEMFEPFLGAKIRFLRPAAPGAERLPIELDLIEVNRSRQMPLAGRMPFSLLFCLRNETPLNDRLLHQLSLEGFEPCELLISRVLVPTRERHDGTMYYEAVFA